MQALMRSCLQINPLMTVQWVRHLLINNHLFVHNKRIIPNVTAVAVRGCKWLKRLKNGKTEVIEKRNIEKRSKVRVQSWYSDFIARAATLNSVHSREREGNGGSANPMRLETWSRGPHHRQHCAAQRLRCGKKGSESPSPVIRQTLV